MNQGGSMKSPFCLYGFRQVFQSPASKNLLTHEDEIG